MSPSVTTPAPMPVPESALRGEARLQYVCDMMREVSQQTDPMSLVATYARRVRELIPADAMVSLSRRDLASPRVKITRSSKWTHTVDPWKDANLPIVERGLLSDLIWGDRPVLLNDLHVAEDDPAFEYAGGMRSLAAIPLFDRGESLNMVVLLRDRADGFDAEDMPEHVWISNLFGRATHSLVLNGELERARQTVERELETIGQMQRTLLPPELPKIPRLDLAASYETSQHAGGDYYDFFPLDDGRWGMLIADVSGHGTPAAVIMAVTHAIAHLCPTGVNPASTLLAYLNRSLNEHYTGGTGTFVTGFYGIFDPTSGRLEYANAGHMPPRVRGADGTVRLLDGRPSLPMGIERETAYDDHAAQLRPDDVLVLYTDGLIESRGPGGELWGEQRLDAVINASRCCAHEVLNDTLAAVSDFCNCERPADDRTLVVAKVLS